MDGADQRSDLLGGRLSDQQLSGIGNRLYSRVGPRNLAIINHLGQKLHDDDVEDDYD